MGQALSIHTLDMVCRKTVRFSFGLGSHGKGWNGGYVRIAPRHFKTPSASVLKCVGRESDSYNLPLLQKGAHRLVGAVSVLHC